MKVSLRWLAELVELPTEDAHELSHAFNMLGHGVESVVHHRADWEEVVIGRVDSIKAHGNADNLRVAQVDVGDGHLHQIVCGAMNFDMGAVVAVAAPGARLPGDFKIETRTIRGVDSNGMICSEFELGLGENHSGILVLPPESPHGAPLDSVLELPDTVFELDITNNRPDVMSMVGVARELAAWFNVPYQMPVVALETTPGAPTVQVTVGARDGCNRFTAREVRGVASSPVPMWLRQRLHKAGVRSISNVVDITNYVMLEFGHPLHAFDADEIEGDVLDVRWAAPGDTIRTIDGIDRLLDAGDLTISDMGGPTSLAAVMGGARSEVTTTTNRVLMEAASWEPRAVMYTSRRHNLQSEASSRFERGVDPNLAPLANDRACQLLVEIAGGEVLETQIDEVVSAAKPWTIDLTERDIQRLMGTDFSLDKSIPLLERLDLVVSGDGSTAVVTVPTNRRDLTRPADLVEEIARLSDLGTLASTVPKGTAGGLSTPQRRRRRLTRALQGVGLNQAVNLPFVSIADVDAFGGKEADAVAVRNPLREDQAALRLTLLPGLLGNLVANLNRGANAVALFEAGRVFYRRPMPADERLPDQPMRIAIAVCGAFGDSYGWSQVGQVGGELSLALCDHIGSVLGIRLDRESARPSGYHPTRTAAVSIRGDAVGFAGELHPAVAQSLGIAGRVSILELDMAPLIVEVPPVEMTPLSTYPHSDLDLSFVVPSDLEGRRLIDATVAVSSVVERATLFDEYRNLSNDGYLDSSERSRSIGIRYRLRSAAKTLDRKAVDEERDRMVAAAAVLGAVLRGSS